ncbi:MAG: hypothetical protein J6Q30_03345 [Oscillospiraceae bacterium]|nr:hypothetical protein [Oscillospiraceae bacterium]
MKKWMVGVILLLSVVLCGCSNVKTFEVISDNIVDFPSPTPAKVHLRLPDDATLSVMNGSDGQSYEGDHYQIIVQTYPSGDLSQTLQLITGYSKNQLNVMEVTEDNLNKYLCAWSAVSEEGELVGRCAVLDDGRYHYCLSVLVDAQMSGEIREDIDAIFADYSLEGY